MEIKMSSVPLIVLLIILVTGCIYYVWLYRMELSRVFKNLVNGNKLSPDLKDKSIQELEELLSTHKSLEHFERCAEIRDEIARR